MMQSGLISVIIPVYNTEKYLRQCVDSVLAQTYQNLEIILVDDGSTDDSGKICDAYCKQNEKVRVIHQGNKGLSATRNIGFDYAKGEYIYFLDSDDWLLESALEKLVSAIERRNCDFAFCEAYAMEESTGRISVGQYSYHRDYGVGPAKAFFEEMLRYREFHTQQSLFLYRKNIIDRFHLRFLEGFVYEDCLFAYQIFLKSNEIVHVHELLYNRRYRRGSIMTSRYTKKKFRSACRIYESCLEISKKNESINSNLYLARLAMGALSNYYRLQRKEQINLVAEYQSLKQSILDHNAFGDGSLKAYCQGRFSWLLYKVLCKIFRKKHG